MSDFLATIPEFPTSDVVFTLYYLIVYSPHGLVVKVALTWNLHMGGVGASTNPR